MAGRRHLTLIEYDVQPILKNYHVVDVKFTKSKIIELLIADPFDINFVKRIIDIAEIINQSQSAYFAYEIDALTDRYELNIYVSQIPRTIDFSKDGTWVEIYAPLPKQVSNKICSKIREFFGNVKIRSGYGVGDPCA